MVDRCKVGHHVRCGNRSGALVRLRPLRDVVWRMTIAVWLLLVALRTVGLLLWSKVLSRGTETLGREHRPAHHWYLSSVGLVLGRERLELVTRKLLVEEHVSHTMLRRNVVVQLTIEEP